MLKIRIQNRFEKDYKLIRKRNLPTEELWEVVKKLQQGESLPAGYRDHQLTNSRDFKDVRECHIRPDWLLLYQINAEELTLILIRTGTHSDLFA